MGADLLTEFSSWCLAHDVALPSGSSLKLKGRLVNLKHPKKKLNVEYTYYSANSSTTGTDMIRCMWWDDNMRVEYFHYGTSTTLSPEEKKKIDERLRDSQRRVEMKRDEQAKLAYKEYMAMGVQCKKHKYLENKGIPAFYGVVYATRGIEFRDADDKLRFEVRKGDILIPAITLEKKFRTYQRIRYDGDKRLRCDAPKRGAVFPIGIWNPKTTKKAILVEGYSTGASLFKALQTIYSMDDYVVLVCFDIHNISEVAQILKNNYSHIDVILATDYDLNTKTQTGLKAGLAISQQFDLKFTFPSKVKNGSDWNDLSFEMSHEEMGMHFLEQIEMIKTQGLTYMQDEYQKLVKIIPRVA